MGYQEWPMKAISPLDNDCNCKFCIDHKKDVQDRFYRQEHEMLKESVFYQYIKKVYYSTRENDYKEYVEKLKKYFMAIPSEHIILYYHSHYAALKACEAAMELENNKC